MSGNFLSCNKGVKDLLEVPEFRCDKPRDDSAEMGLISPGGENLLDFLELRHVLKPRGKASWESLEGKPQIP